MSFWNSSSPLKPKFLWPRLKAEPGYGCELSHLKADWVFVCVAVISTDFLSRACDFPFALVQVPCTIHVFPSVELASYWTKIASSTYEIVLPLWHLWVCLAWQIGITSHGIQIWLWPPAPACIALSDNMTVKTWEFRISADRVSGLTWASSRRSTWLLTLLCCPLWIFLSLLNCVPTDGTVLS